MALRLLDFCYSKFHSAALLCIHSYVLLVAGETDNNWVSIMPELIYYWIIRLGNPVNHGVAMTAQLIPQWMPLAHQQPSSMALYMHLL